MVRIRFREFVAFVETSCSELLVFSFDSLHLEPSRMFREVQGMYLFLFLRPPRGFAKPRKARDDRILNKPPTSIRVIYYAVPFIRIMRK